MFWPSQGLQLGWFFEQMTEVFGEIFKYQSVKAKDEDSEWEMIWDAEGGMHLINKGSKVVPPAADLHTPGKRYNKRKLT
jgi:hypothetical protein